MRIKTTLREDMINGGAELIRAFSPGLAKKWLNEPFNRVSIAYAFASGFAKNDTDDINHCADLVIRMALNDHEVRKLEKDIDQIKGKIHNLKPE